VLYLSSMKSCLKRCGRALSKNSLRLKVHSNPKETRTKSSSGRERSRM
jgi:hypothetical protein